MKYYAVRKGRKVGIFTNWDECKASIDKFPGQEYKSFPSEDEANDYLNGVNKIPLSLPNHSYAFVDGSFNPNNNITGFGGFLIDNNGQKHVLQGSSVDPEMISMRNVAGEVLGAMEAAQIAKQLKMTSLTIFYDYNGIESWVTGAWKCNNAKTEEYRTFMQRAIGNGIHIDFQHVKGHTGIPGNEEADRLAKIAVGIIKEDRER